MYGAFRCITITAHIRATTNQHFIGRCLVLNIACHHIYVTVEFNVSTFRYMLYIIFLQTDLHL